MSDEPNDGGPAYPAMTPGGYCTPGMTLRDWFAGQALAALIASEVNETSHGDSEDAYMYADAMLAARELTPDTTTAQQIALGIGGGK